MKSIFTIIIILFSVITFADTTVTTDDGKKVILKSNGTWEYKEKESGNNEFKYAEDAVHIWDVSLFHWEKNYKINRYSNCVALAFHYKNITHKKIVGIEVQCIIKNPFNKILLDKIFQDEVVVEPMGKLKKKMFWTFEDNEFINGQPYDRLKLCAMNGTGKITTKIVKVIFADGTVLKGKP